MSGFWAVYHFVLDWAISTASLLDGSPSTFMASRGWIPIILLFSPMWWSVTAPTALPLGWLWKTKTIFIQVSLLLCLFKHPLSTHTVTHIYIWKLTSATTVWTADQWAAPAEQVAGWIFEGLRQVLLLFFSHQDITIPGLFMALTEMSTLNWLL